MFLSLLPCLAALAAPSLVAGAVDISSLVGKTSSSTTTVPNRYIVEFDTNSQMSALGKRDIHDHVYAQLEARSVSYSVKQTYNSDVFVGASVQLTNEQDLVTLANLNGVVNIMPVHVVPRPSVPVSDIDFGKKWTTKTSSKRNLQERGNNNGNNNGQGHTNPTSTSTTTAASSTATVFSPGATRYPLGPQGFSANPMSGIDKLQAQGYTGKGIKIGLIDSGIDYTNPVLGGCFGAGCKVAGGYDYVGDNFDGSNEPMPGPDPLDQCNGHGTVTAGIIGANSPNMYNITGTAPSASLYAYRIFSCSYATTDDIVGIAMQDAYTQGMDVINLSLGELTSWTSSFLAVIASNIAKTGVAVVSSVGNDGLDGNFYVESPSTGVGVWSVGSTESFIYPAQLANVSTGYGPITYFKFVNLTDGSLPIMALSTTYPNNSDACTVTDQLTNTDYSGKVLIIQESSDPNCDIITIIGNLYYNTTVEVVLMINLPGSDPLYSNGYPIEFASISPNDGQYLLGQIAAGKNVELDFSFRPVTVPNTLSGNYTSIFSATGPTNDMYMKPDLVAVGGNIVSTAPMQFNGGFTFASGTSFSAPAVAGAAALYMSAKGGRANAPQNQVLNAYQAKAGILPVTKSDQSLQTVSRQGAGTLKAYDAIHAGLQVSPTELLLNDTAYFNGVQTVTVTNTGSSKTQFTFSHIPVDTVFSKQQGSNESEFGPNLPESSASAGVNIFPPVLNLKAGQRGTVLVSFTPPSGLDATRFPVYSGFISIASSNSETANVPYIGVAAAMKNLPILDFTANYDGTKLPTITNSSGLVQTNRETYTLNGTDVPTVMYRLWGGTPALYIDLVSANANLGFSPTFSKRMDHDNAQNDVIPGLLWWLKNHGRGPGSSANSFQAVPIIGNVYQSLFNGRNSGPNPSYNDDNEINSFAFSGTFTNGTGVPNGSYKLLLRALKVTGNPTKESDYESWLSPVFIVQQ